MQRQVKVDKHSDRRGVEHLIPDHQSIIRVAFYATTYHSYTGTECVWGDVRPKFCFNYTVVPVWTRDTTENVGQDAAAEMAMEGG